MKYKIFVYGTLTSKPILDKLIGLDYSFQEAILFNYVKAKDQTDYLFLNKQNNTKTKGYILNVSLKQLLICDCFEEVPYYQRYLLDVYNVDKQTYEKAYVYNRKAIGNFDIVDDKTIANINIDSILNTINQNYQNELNDYLFLIDKKQSLNDKFIFNQSEDEIIISDCFKQLNMIVKTKKIMIKDDNVELNCYLNTDNNNQVYLTIINCMYDINIVKSILNKHFNFKSYFSYKCENDINYLNRLINLIKFSFC